MDDASSEYIHGNSQDKRERFSLLNEILNDAFLKELHLKPCESILDFGSWLGQFTRRMAEVVGPQVHVVGKERDHD